MATMEPQASDRAGLFAKMVDVMASMERIPKRGRNTHFNYDFVTDGDVLDAVRAALVEHRIAFFVSFDDATHRDKGITTGKFTLTFADADTGQTVDVQWVGEGQDTQDKGAAKALTSAVKYALLKTFLISTGDAADDPDAGASANAPRKRPSQPAKSQTPHWIEDEKTRKGFWAWTGEQGLSRGDVHAALGVEHVKDFAGGKGAAVDAISKWIGE